MCDVGNRIRGLCTVVGVTEVLMSRSTRREIREGLREKEIKNNRKREAKRKDNWRDETYERNIRSIISTSFASRGGRYAFIRSILF